MAGYFQEGGVLPLDFLSGPISISYHQGIEAGIGEKKNIFILGDLHGDFEGECRPCEQPNCEHVYNYLRTVFKRTPVWIDFYVEKPFLLAGSRAKASDENHDFLTTTIYAFDRYDCFHRQTTQCSLKYPKTRFHYVDIRRLIYDSKEYRSLPFDLFYTIYRLKKGEITFIHPDFFNYLRAIRDSHLGQFYRNYVTAPNLWILIQQQMGDYFHKEDSAEYLTREKPNRIKKQLDNLSPYLRQELIKFYLEKSAGPIDVIEKKFSQLWTASSALKRSKIIKTLHSNLLKLIILIMDVYTLARVFRTYPSGPGRLYPERPKHVDSKEVWIYVGDYHAQNYREFISRSLNENFLYASGLAERNQKRCLSTENILS